MQGKVGVAFVADKMRKMRLWWFEHCNDAPIKEVWDILATIKVRRGNGIWKELGEVIRHDLAEL